MNAPELTWQSYYTLIVLGVMVWGLVRGVARTHLVLLGSLGLLLVANVIGPMEAFAGLANPAVVAIGALFVVAAGVDRTGAIAFLDPWLRPRSSRVGPAVARIMAPTALLSGVLNNTPIVAVLLPRIQAWAREGGPPSAKLLIPLSTAAIVGGWLTLIGTSTNIVVHGLLQAEGLPGFGFFTLSVVGVPAVLIVTAYYALIGHRLLPQGGGQSEVTETQNYLFELRVTEDALFDGQSVEAAGFRTLGDAFLARIHRDGRELAVTPDVSVIVGDTLVFVGGVSAYDVLLARSGLQRVTSVVTEGEVSVFALVEAVVAPGSDLDGKTLRDIGFREQFGGVVVAIRRGPQDIDGGLGRTPLRGGDLLLVEGPAALVDRLRARSGAFALVAPLRQSRPKTSRAPAALAIGASVILIAATGVAPLATAAFAGALGMIVTGCLRGGDLLQAVDVPVLLVIAAALGIGAAVETTGLAAVAAQGIGTVLPYGAVATLAVVYAVTNGLAELVTNKAAAVLMLPVALDVASALDVNWVPFAVAVTIASAASFLSPIGYQTNLMVMGAGGYRFSDFTRAGLPVSALVMSVTVISCSLFWL